MSVWEAKQLAARAAEARRRGLQLWQWDMILAEGGAMREVIADGRKPNPVTHWDQSPIPPRELTPEEREARDRAPAQPSRPGDLGWGWRSGVPLEVSVPYQREVNALIDAQDARDRADLRAKFAAGPKGDGR
jgi:hypothetical protein